MNIKSYNVKVMSAVFPCNDEEDHGSNNIDIQKIADMMDDGSTDDFSDHDDYSRGYLKVVFLNKPGYITSTWIEDTSGNIELIENNSPLNDDDAYGLISSSEVFFGYGTISGMMFVNKESNIYKGPVAYRRVVLSYNFDSIRDFTESEAAEMRELQMDH